MTNSSNRVSRYIGDAVLGGTDGIITTFAVVAGVEGADLSLDIIVILGCANLIADGFSMGAGNFLGVLSSRYYKRSEYRRLSQQIEEQPEQMKEQLRSHYITLGFEGSLLDEVIEQVSSSKKRWAQALLYSEKLSEDGRSPFAAGMATFLSFLLFGFLPLIFYFSFIFTPDTLPYSAFSLTVFSSLFALALLGALRALITKGSVLLGAFQILLVGGVAGALAYSVGSLLHSLVGIGS